MKQFVVPLCLCLLISSLSGQHCYLIVKRLTLTDPQWGKVVDGFKSLAPNTDRREPCYKNHRRSSLGGSQWIFEGQFSALELSDSSMTKLVATTLAIDPALVKIQTTELKDGNRIRTIRASGVDVVEVTTFGGDAPVIADSRAKITIKLATDKALWEATVAEAPAEAVKEVKTGGTK